jgi:prepilin-type N-terminal cleavage/methylation domain-containing protein
MTQMRPGAVLTRDARSDSSARVAGGSVKRGFTLIEVIVAMAIMMIVVLGMVAAYTAFYGRITQARVATIGQNLAQLQLEDALSMNNQVLGLLVHNQDIGDINYVNAAASPPLVDAAPLDDTIYDSGKVDGTFYITGVASVNVPSMGLSNHVPSGAADIPDLALPTGIVDLQPVYHASAATPYWDYTVTLHKAVFPGYQRRVLITDTTPSTLNSTLKVFRIEVTIFWTIAGNEQQYTVSAEK